VFIARHGRLDFYRYDPYGQALPKLQRRHDRDLRDVRSMVRDGLIWADTLREMFGTIEAGLILYPAIDPASFRTSVEEFCRTVSQRSTNDLQPPHDGQ